MRICLVGTGDLVANRRVVSLARSLSLVGHTVSIVCGGRIHPDDPVGVRRIPTRVPDGYGALGGALRRVQPSGSRTRSFYRRLAATVVAEEPELVYAFTATGVEIATKAARLTGAKVVRGPNLPDAGDNDIIHAAPRDTTLSSSPSGPGSTIHTSLDSRGAWNPQPGRYSGMRVVMGYRSTDTTPARYLRAAMERAGIEVEQVESLDWSDVPEDTAFVLIVESPYPGLDVIGENPGVPVLLWAHHGEHHTAAQLRLVRRYGVDAVLLAHSWHLAHRFPVPVHRFPFAVAPELVDASIPWDERSHDVAFVGSIPSDDVIYPLRRQLLEDVAQRLGQERVEYVDGVTPENLARIYGDAKVVLNEGGTRHHPITMRVFEAIGNGATLVTTPTPGLECLLRPGVDFIETDPSTAADDVERLVRTGDGATVAERSRTTALESHWYDHRVDELVDIAGSVERGSMPALPPVVGSSIALAIDRFVDIGTVAAYAVPDLADELPLRTVWEDPNPGDRAYDAVVIGSQHPIADGTVFDDAVFDDAVRYIIVDEQSGSLAVLRKWLKGGAIEMSEARYHGVVVVDLDAPGYRVARESTDG